MRFLHFDRVLSIEDGRRIEAVKCVSLADEYLAGRFPRRALVPGTVWVEAMLQSLGWLVIRANDFTVTPFLSLMEDCVVPWDLGPGHRAVLHGTLVSTNPKGSLGSARMLIEGREVGSIGRVVYAHAKADDPTRLRAAFSSYETP